MAAKTPGDHRVDDSDDHGRSGKPVTQTDIRTKAVGLQHAGFVVVRAGNEVGIELRCHLQIGVAEPVHPHDEPGVLDVGLDQPKVSPESD
jgi:hypothetical protein